MADLGLLNNRYQLIEEQGTGGMAMVYRAMDQMLERTVAIKILRTDYSDNEIFREQFRQEAKAAANLSHPNIATVYDFGFDAGRLFIIMEYVSGTDLKTILRQRKILGIQEALSLIIQACSGIGYAHRVGIVHCDIKPQNMLVTPDQNLKVVDFGIARALASIPTDEHLEVVWGSPQYFSPEQASGISPSPASDVYSLGVVLFEMVTGQLPFNGKTAEELGYQHREVPTPSPGKLNPAIPPSLEQVILRVLSKEPAARYRTADQMGRVLASLPIFNKTLNQDISISGIYYSGSSASGVAQPILPQTVEKPVTVKEQAGTAKQSSIVSNKSPKTSASKKSSHIDWLTWLLILLTLIAVGGLVPFWLWAYTMIRPPF